VENDPSARTRELADRVLEMAQEVETHADATVEGEALQRSRDLLHGWIDTVSGVVVNAALGRVTLIHADGRQSTIASPDLPFILSRGA
jgi:hypothetical protein